MAALSYGYLDYARHRSAIAATDGLVQSVATAIVNHQGTLLAIYGWRQMRSVPNFDVNQDGILDGVPEKVNAVSADTFNAAIINSGYEGFLSTTGTDLPIRNLDEQGQVIDSWGMFCALVFMLNAMAPIALACGLSAPMAPPIPSMT